jgi:hypothetical protein
MRILVLLILTLLGTSIPTASHAGVDISVSFDLFAPPPVAVAPPPLPVYVVPAPPVEGYIWAPGHWRWSEYGYFWVPGTWVQPPVIGLLWTPGYWSWREGAFAWHEGYWASHVGFYGGVNYGGGYGGNGFSGGSWNHGTYIVNRSVTNVTNITNVTNVTNNNTTINNTSNASFSGGPGGTTAVPTAEQQAAANEKHIPPTQEQIAHVRQASQNPALAASANHGKPAIAATARAGDFRHGVVQAKQAGAVNPAAEKHNASIRQNPAIAKGAAMPKPSVPQPRQDNEPTHHPVEHPEEHRPAGVEPHKEHNEHDEHERGEDQQHERHDHD